MRSVRKQSTTRGRQSRVENRSTRRATTSSSSSQLSSLSSNMRSVKSGIGSHYADSSSFTSRQTTTSASQRNASSSLAARRSLQLSAAAAAVIPTLSFTPPTERLTPVVTNAKRGFYHEAQHPDVTIHSPENAPGAAGLSPHTIRVKTLYRKMVKEYFNHYGFDLDLYYVKVAELRNEFEKHRHEKDYGTVNTLIKEAEVFLHETATPDPYRTLTDKLGGLYGRNRPLPREFLRPYPGVPAHGIDYGIEEKTIRFLHDPANTDGSIDDVGGIAGVHQHHHHDPEDDKYDTVDI